MLIYTQKVFSFVEIHSEIYKSDSATDEHINFYLNYYHMVIFML